VTLNICSMRFRPFKNNIRELMLNDEAHKFNESICNATVRRLLTTFLFAKHFSTERSVCRSLHCVENWHCSATAEKKTLRWGGGPVHCVWAVLHYQSCPPAGNTNWIQLSSERAQFNFTVVRADDWWTDITYCLSFIVGTNTFHTRSQTCRQHNVGTNVIPNANSVKYSDISYSLRQTSYCWRTLITAWTIYYRSAKRDSEIVSSLESATKHPLLCAKTTRFKNMSFHTHCQTINDCLDVIVELRYSSCRTLVSIQLSSCQTNKPVNWLLIDYCCSYTVSQKTVPLQCESKK